MNWLRGPIHCGRIVLVSSMLILMMLSAEKTKLASVPAVYHGTPGFSPVNGPSMSQAILELRYEKISNGLKSAKTATVEPVTWKIENGWLLTGSENGGRRRGLAGCLKPRYFDLAVPVVPGRGLAMQPNNVLLERAWESETNSWATWPTGVSRFFERHYDPATLDPRRLYGIVSTLRQRLRTRNFKGPPESEILQGPAPGVCP